MNIFDSQADKWWDKNGNAKFLHRMLAARMSFINEYLNNRNSQSILDFGCGAGLVSIPLAKQGHKVTAIDSSNKMINAAREQDADKIVDWHCVDINNWDSKNKYDTVICLEVLEHVDDISFVLSKIKEHLKYDGIAIISTIKRGLLAFLGTILYAEYLAGIIPIGTHKYSHLINPSELQEALLEISMEIFNIKALNYNPLTEQFYLGGALNMNYIAAIRNL